MILSFENKIFSDVVNKVVRFADKKNTTLPVLSSILIIADKETIKMRATNLETGIDYKIPGVCVDGGVVAIPSTIIQQIANSITTEGTLSFEHTGDTAAVNSGAWKSIIKTIPYTDFPSIPFPENAKNRIVLSGSIFKSVLSSVALCASTSTVRPELSSIYISIEGGVLTVVATDSFRLAEKKIPINNKGTQGKFLIPTKNAIDIAQTISDEEIIISFDEHQCAFVCTSNIIVSRLTNAVYPDYKQIIPKESIVEAIVLRKDFEQALKHTAIFTDVFQKIHLNFTPNKNTLTLSSSNNEIGESSETLTAQVSGSPLNISLNHRYLNTILGLTTSESISITAAGIGRPLIIRGVQDTSLLYLISPMNQ